jgi:peptide/nickel transport system substrate-binding protein
MPAKFLVFTPLVAWNNRGVLEPHLAESWHYSPNHRSCTIRLRDDIRWHDGMPVTAHDMKFTLDLLQHPDTLQFAPGSYTVNVIDRLTYTIAYHRQDITDDGAVNDWTACWPKHLLEKLDPKQINTWDFWSHPVGNGPYRHVRTVPQTVMEFEANPDNFRGRPKIAKVILKFGGSSAVPELISGNVDAVGSNFNRRDILWVSRDRRFRTYQQAVMTGNGLWWNHRHCYFQDAAIRRALTYAINRRELCEVLNVPADTRLMDFPVTDRQLRRGDFPEAVPHNRELAMRLLDQSGWLKQPGKRLRERSGKPFRFKALVLTPQAANPDAGVYVQDQLKRIGVHMDIITVSDYGLMASRIRSGEFEAAITGLGTGELTLFLRAIGYRNPSFFRLLEKTQVTFDPDEKDRLYCELTAVFQADTPVTVLYPFTSTTIASKRIRGLENSPYRGDLTQCMRELSLEEQV